MKIFITEEIDPSENILRVPEDDVIEVNVTQELMKKVIRNRNPIEIEYSKDGLFIKRVLHIHAFGMNRNGNLQVYAYQQTGGSTSGQKSGMKLFNYVFFGKKALIYKDMKFSPDSTYSRDPIYWTDVYAQI